MEQLVGYIATGLISLIVGYLLQRMEARPKLLFWLPGSFLFQLQNPQVSLRTDSVTIQNVGRKPATNLEIVYETRPDHFQFSTPIPHTEDTTPDGHYVLKIPSLGANEHVNIQLLSHIKQPVLLTIRSAEGPAQLIQVHLQRIFPRWIQMCSAGLILLGFGFLLYWVVLAVVHLSKATGFI